MSHTDTRKSFPARRTNSRWSIDDFSHLQKTFRLQHLLSSNHHLYSFL